MSYPPQYPPQQPGYPQQQPGYPQQQQPGYPPPPQPGYGAPEAPPVHDANSLPVNDNVNPYAFSVDLNGPYYLQKGKMIAYYGDVRFSGIGRGSIDRALGRNFNSPLHATDWVVAEGRGKLLLADRAFDLNSYDLENGNLTVRSGNLLAFEPTLALKQSIIPGFLTLIGTGKFVAASNGPVHFVEPPIRVDPQALVGWADCPAPCHHYDHGYMHGVLGGLRQLTGLGGASGEEHQFEFHRGRYGADPVQRDPDGRALGRRRAPGGRRPRRRLRRTAAAGPRPEPVAERERPRSGESRRPRTALRSVGSAVGLIV